MKLNAKTGEFEHCEAKFITVRLFYMPAYAPSAQSYNLIRYNFDGTLQCDYLH